MLEGEARRMAEELVYVYYTWDDILFACEARGIKTLRRTRYKSRSELEAALIDKLVEEYKKEC